MIMVASSSRALSLAWRGLVCSSNTVGTSAVSVGAAAARTSRSMMSTLIPPGRTLGEVTHLELLESEPAETITEIWHSYHDDRPGFVGMQMDQTKYRALTERTAQSPMFVIPLHKSMARFHTLVLQANLPYLSFTAIDDFRKLQGAAQPMLIAAHYSELLESKGLVLVQAAHLTPRSGMEALSAQEAKRLVHLCHKFYTDDERYERYVSKFNHDQKAFDFDAFVGEVAELTWTDEMIK